MADILIIEDDVDLRAMLKQVLEQAKYSVIEAGDGEEGCQVFSKQRTKVVITDVFMPKKDGLQAIQWLRTESPHTVIIATTGGNKNIGPNGWMTLLQNLGAAYVLKKPFEISKLLTYLDEIFRKSSTVR